LNSNYSIKDAEAAIRRRFAKDGSQKVLRYDASKVIENDRWWYIPFCWIGCLGFIVNRDNLYVNWLGSASGLNLDQCFWGHDNSIFCDLVDFEFSPNTDIRLAQRLLPKFQHTNPDHKGMQPSGPVWYRDSEITSALSAQFPIFKRHFVWLAIADLHHAYENEGLRFTSCLSDSLI
jgi:hypothetical protein